MVMLKRMAFSIRTSLKYFEETTPGSQTSQMDVRAIKCPLSKYR